MAMFIKCQGKFSKCGAYNKGMSLNLIPFFMNSDISPKNIGILWLLLYHTLNFKY